MEAAAGAAARIFPGLVIIKCNANIKKCNVFIDKNLTRGYNIRKTDKED